MACMVLEDWVGQCESMITKIEFTNWQRVTGHAVFICWLTWLAGTEGLGCKVFHDSLWHFIRHLHPAPSSLRFNCSSSRQQRF